jgi:O-antigen/teichoic acid export membrane protein
MTSDPTAPAPAASKSSGSRDAGILVIGRVADSVSKSLLILLIVRVLGKADVGVFVTLQLLYETIALILLSGFPAAVMYYFPPVASDVRHGLLLQFRRLTMVLGGFAGALLAMIALVDHQWPAAFEQFTVTEDGRVSLQYLWVLALLPMFDLPSRVVSNVLIVEGQPRAAAAFGVIRGLGRSAFTLVPIAAGWGLWSVVGSMLAWGVLFFVGTEWYLARRVYRNSRPAPTGERPLSILRFALPLGLTEMIGIINQKLDRYLVLFFFSAAYIADYEFGAWQIPFLVSIPYAVGTAYSPQLRAHFAAGQPQRAMDVWRESTVKTALIVIPATFVFIVGAEEAITLLFTEEYASAAPIFRWYCIYSLGRVTTFGSVLVAAGQPSSVLKATMLSLVLNLGFSLPLTFAMGVQGPAAGTALSFIPLAAGYCWMIARASKLPMSSTFPVVGVLKVVLATAPGVVLAWWLKGQIDGSNGAMLGLFAAVVMSSFAVVGTLTGVVSRQDWRFVGQWLSLRLLRRSP